MHKLFDLSITRKILHYPLMLCGSIGSLLILTLLWLISPIIKIRMGALIGQRIGHLALNTDLFFRKQQLHHENKRIITIFIVGRVANQQLLKMWKRHAIIIQSQLIRGLFEYSRWIWEKTHFYEPLDMFSNEYYEFNAAQPTLTFPQEEKIKGNNALREMGINPDKDWFVCILARDSAYLNKELGQQKDWSYHDYRNVDIDTYVLAIDHIVALGGFVIRMGYHVNKVLNYKHPKVIDYAIKGRTDFMDIFLAGNCRFFLGNNSGMIHVAQIFDRPQVGVNVAPPTSMVFGKNCLFIPKKIKNLASDEFISFKKFITESVSPNEFEFYSHGMLAKGWTYEDNSPEEILDVTVEMIERLEGRYHPTEEDTQLLNKYYSLYPKNHWAEKNKTPIGIKFLKENQKLFFEKEISLLDCDETA